MMGSPPTHDEQPSDLSFGPFRLLPSQQLLLDGNTPVSMGARALDILTLLVGRAGEVVSKNELIHRAWPNVIVEEGNLRTQLALIRKALRDGEAGARYIVTVPGRGYRFVASVSRSAEPSPPSASTQESPPPSPMPIRLTRVIGRETAISEVASRLSRRRFTTVVGPGGIGKTTVALAVAEQQAALYEDGICFVDLASLIDPLTLPATLASKLGVSIASRDIMPELAARLRNRHLLLVLDSCEKFIEAAAVLAETLLKETVALHILATSREPLRAESETIYRLSPLTIPATSDRLSAAEALAFSAVELFVERASSIDAFALVDEDAPIVVDICRQLDGIALAIELAAVRVSTLGVKGIAIYLKDRFRLLTRGRRTALPRHRTLEATLDWSYEMLPERERATLRRLAIFSGNFALDAARAIAANSDDPWDETLDVVDELVSKSLVSADAAAGVERAYRLLDTTRAYAAKKLVESGEADQIARRHASYCLDLFSNGDGKASATTKLLARATPLLDDIRAALNWAFSSDANGDMGAQLTTAAIPLWTYLSLNAECRKYVERALSYEQSESNKDIERNMKLFAALGATLIYTEGPGPKATTALENCLAYAEQLGDTDYQVRALWGLFQVRFNTGEFRRALDLAQRLRLLSATSTDPADALLGDRLIGLAHFYLGDHISGRRYITLMLEGYENLMRDSHIVRFQFDQVIVAKTILARILWALGEPEQAMSKVHELVAEAKSTSHAMSLALGLAQAACPITLWIEDWAAAESYIGFLVEHTSKHGLELWNAWGNCFEGMLLIARGEYQPGLRLLRAAMNRLPQHHMRYGGSYAYLAEALGATGQISAGLSVIQEVLGRCEQDEERWHIAEYLRIRGELFRLQRGPTAVEAAEESFLQSLEWARRQGVLSWELRGAMSLARLRVEQMRTAEAHQLVSSTLARFAEGFGTADLAMARKFVDHLV
jgi:predicted ATPase/DNA-binding winged helix-turn-helix (wHTH) protein